MKLLFKLCNSKTMVVCFEMFVKFYFNYLCVILSRDSESKSYSVEFKLLFLFIMELSC